MNNQVNNIAYLGIGSNLGNKSENIEKAIDLIGKIETTSIESVSSFYETKPFGNLEQENFVNAAVKISTGLEPLILFSELKSVEKRLGRKEGMRWGPREMDIDILFYNDLIFSDEIITLPHKGVIYRDFVLVPLMEIEPDLIHPIYKKKINNFLMDLKSKFILNKISSEFKIKDNII